MFTSLEFINYKFKTKSCVYKLIDTDFEHIVSIKNLAIFDDILSIPILIIIVYKEKKYPHQEICKNLFMGNKLLQNKYKFSSLESKLEYQNKYIDQEVKGLDFSKTYYKDLKNMIDKYQLFV